MRIAYFITGLGLGGAEVITLDLAKKALGAGHEVIVVWLSGLDALAGGVPPGIGLHPLGMRKTPAGLVRALRQARWIVRDFRPDVVHSNMIHSNIFTRLLRLVAPFPALICSEHTHDTGSRTRMLAYRITDGLSDLNTNVSRESVAEFVRRGLFRKDGTMTVYNGVDLRRFTPDREAGRRIRERYGIGPGEFLWLNVGRLTPAKDQANLLRAFRRLERGRLLILGEGELRGALEKQIAEAGLAERVILAGAHPNVADFCNAADGFVVSSAWEGFSVALVEAMSCGLPAVATDVSGCYEALGSREFIVPTRRDDLLAEKMSLMAGLPPERRRKIGIGNRALAGRFDIDKIWQQWEEIYGSLCK